MTDNVVHIIILVAEILLGIAIMIPLVKKFADVSKENVEEKNWYYFLGLILDDMKFVQEAYESGESRKDMVLKMIEVNADAVNYPLTEEEKVKLATMIDSLVEMANIVGVRNMKHEVLQNTIAINEEGQEITVDQEEE